MILLALLYGYLLIGALFTLGCVVAYELRGHRHLPRRVLLWPVDLGQMVYFYLQRKK